jgi:hypothetical protein
LNTFINELDEAESSAKVAWLEWIVFDEENFVEKCELQKCECTTKRIVSVVNWEGNARLIAPASIAKKLAKQKMTRIRFQNK